MIKLIYPKFWQERCTLAYLLWPLSCIFYLGAKLRKIFANPVTLPGRVICVGNITAGGTGKTQLAIYLAKFFKSKEINFVIITKAYKGNITKPVIVNENHRAEEVGDEAIELRRHGPVIAVKKVVDAQAILSTLKPEIIIIDDGLQNPHFLKDMNILIIDEGRSIGNRFLIPAGPMRQHLNEALSITDIVITIAGNKPIDEKLYQSLIESKKPLFTANILPAISLDKTKNYLAFTGIGDPDRFFFGLKNYGLNLIKTKIFPDHYFYTKNDLENLQKLAKANDARLITTRKDYVKIYQKLPVLCFDVELQIEKQEKLFELIHAKLF